MKKNPVLTRTLLSLAISALGMPMAAHATLNFSTAPAGSANKETAPNVIVSKTTQAGWEPRASLH